MGTQTPRPNGFDAASLSIGDRLGAYEIRGRIGSGGLTAVWKGYDGLLDRHVVIKQLAGELQLDEAAQQRFRADTAARMQVSGTHKTLVEIIEFLEEERGLFIVTELVDGRSLESLLNNAGGPIDAKQTLRIVGQVALALAALHKKDITHRDLNPSNILVTSTGRVKVCDFGLATLRDVKEAHDPGSVRYMAGELLNEAVQVDGRADIYALGMIAYEMLAGRAAFEQAFKAIMRDPRHQRQRWMKWHRNRRLTAPPLTKLNPEVPEMLAELVARMMAKDRDQRIDSARQVIKAIKGYVVSQRLNNQETATLSPDDGSSPAGLIADRPPAKRKRLVPLMIVAATVGIAAVIGTIVYLDVMRPAAEQRRAYEQDVKQFQAARRAFLAHRFDEARSIFERLMLQWTDDKVIHRHSKAHVFLCDAQLAIGQARRQMDENMVAAAAASYRKAKEDIEKVERLGFVDPDSPNLVGDISDTIEMGMALAQHVIDVAGLIDQRQFAESRKKLRDWRSKFAETLTAEEKRRLDALDRRISHQETQVMIRQVIARANHLMEQEKPAQAAELLAGAKPYDPMSPQLADTARRVERQLRYTEALTAGEAAEMSGRLDEAIMQYRRAGALQPGETIDARIARARSRRAFQAGWRLEENGDFQAAGKAYLESLTIWNGNRQAEQGIARIDVTNWKKLLIESGDNAADERDHESAMKYYRRALELDPDAQTQVKLEAVSIRFHVKRAQQLFGVRKLYDARAELRKVLRLDDANAEAQQLLADYDLMDEYLQLVMAGDELRREGAFNAAKRKYLQAKALLAETSSDLDEIRRRINDVDYEGWIASARGALAAGKWARARADLMAAQNIRNTEQVRELIAEVDQQERSEE